MWHYKCHVPLGRGLTRMDLNANPYMWYEYPRFCPKYQWSDWRWSERHRLQQPNKSLDTNIWSVLDSDIWVEEKHVYGESVGSINQVGIQHQQGKEGVRAIDYLCIRSRPKPVLVLMKYQIKIPKQCNGNTRKRCIIGNRSQWGFPESAACSAGPQQIQGQSPQKTTLSNREVIKWAVMMVS